MAAGTESIQDVLKKLNLEEFISNFEKEKITTRIIPTLKDEDIERLGIKALGDRIRLRQMCAKAISDGTSNVAASTSFAATGDRATYAIRERLNIFGARRSGGPNKKATKKAARSWTPQFLCLAKKDTTKVPTANEKQALSRAGLGLKKIKLDLDDDEEAVTSKIVSSVCDEYGETLGFPRLKNIGGFDMLYCGANSRDLYVLSCARSARVLRQSIGGAQCKIYLRPIQMDLTYDNDMAKRTKSYLLEKCRVCDKSFPIGELREHFSTCSNFTTSVDGTDDGKSDTSSSSDEGNASLDMPIGSSNNTESPTNSITPLITPRENASSEIQDSLVTVDLTTDDTGSSNGQQIEESSVQEPLTSVIEKIIGHCKKENVEDPCDVLKYAQQQIVFGRPLEVTNPDEYLVGDTNFILVDRDNLLATSFDEINAIDDPRKTLEVQFYNETAQDSGGPRKEFFRLVLKEIKEAYFGECLRSDAPEKYVTIGLIFGLSILQNGNIPLFLGEKMIQDIFSTANTSQCITKLQEGLSKLGIYQIGCHIPTFLYIFRNDKQKILTYKILTNLLQPQYSEPGSNAEKYEKMVYTLFLKYLREAASGRRGNITLQHVLQFATGADREPLLGFSLKPRMLFTEVRDSFLPTANTCINALTMPRPSYLKPLPEAKQLYTYYDYAFSSSYFGNR